MSKNLEKTSKAKRKTRNPEKVIMDRHYHPKVFRRQKRKLEDDVILNEIKEYYDNVQS
jgi:hypothetical protein